MRREKASHLGLEDVCKIREKSVSLRVKERINTLNLRRTSNNV